MGNYTYLALTPTYLDGVPFCAYHRLSNVVNNLKLVVVLND